MWLFGIPWILVFFGQGAVWRLPITRQHAVAKEGINQSATLKVLLYDVACEGSERILMRGMRLSVTQGLQLNQAWQLEPRNGGKDVTPPTIFQQQLQQTPACVVLGLTPFPTCVSGFGATCMETPPWRPCLR